MDASDDVIHQPIRLRVMAALTACDPSGEGLDFTQLKKLTGATDGNLGAHLDHLARAGYVEVTKAFVGRRPRTTVKASAQGRAAFARHVAFLKSIIEAARSWSRLILPQTPPCAGPPCGSECLGRGPRF
jgi:DNA-binding MarR family transcriptional regulator